MKKFLEILVLGLLLSGNAYSLNFNENLGDYEKNNAGHTSTIYILNRCSGILSYVTSLMLKENMPLGKFIQSYEIADLVLKISEIRGNSLNGSLINAEGGITTK